jgi:hypothetical protein
VIILAEHSTDGCFFISANNCHATQLIFMARMPLILILEALRRCARPGFLCPCEESLSSCKIHTERTC